MKYWIWKEIFIILVTIILCHGQVERSLSLLETTALIFGLQKYFHSGCVFFLHSAFRVDYELLDQQMMIQMRKILSELNVATMVVGLDRTKVKLKNLRCQKNRPINVITDGNEIARQTLQQMMSDSDFSHSIWLVLLNTETSIKIFFSDLYVPMDSEVIVAQSSKETIYLTEVYNVERNYPLELYNFGKWTPENGLTATEYSFCVRRSNMRGITMNVVTTQDSPYVTISEYSNGSAAVTGGFFGLVWFEFENKLNFRTKYTALDTGLLSHVVNNTRTDPYTKMIDEVRQEKYDLALAPTRFTVERFQIVDYSYLLHRSKFVIALTPDSEQMAWSHFFGPFQKSLWFVVVGCILVIASCLSAFHYLGRRLAYSQYENADQYNFFVSVFYVFSMFCQQGHDVTPKSCACRLVYWLGYVTALVVLAAYSATLISFLTIQSSEPHVRTLQALAKDRTYKLGMLAQYLRIIRNNPDNGITDEIYNKMIAPDPKNIPATDLEGLQRVCSTKYAFWTSVESIKRVGDAVDCNIVLLPTYYYMFNLAYVVRENNPYKKFINFLITKMQSGGVLKKHKLDSWAAKLPKPQNIWTSVSVRQVSPLLIILTGGILGSIVFLFMEIAVKLLQKNRNKRRFQWSDMKMSSHSPFSTWDLKKMYSNE